ncbi:MAG TPA: hypothetical protein PLF84_08880 [Bryobacteraceae bacterium]|nr:hypothetical protein [Bryobacterales bacterium]HRJ19146.1 hypothetical protein [Bryobacteraceae bacterium]
MRRIVYLLMLMGTASAAAEEVIDRVAVSFGLEVVTLSAIRRQVRMSAYLEGKPVEDTPEARRAAAERLIDQSLVRREMNLSRYTPIPMEEVREKVEEARQKLGLTAEAFEAELRKYGFTTDDFLNELYWQSTLLRFVQFRFSPSVQVSEEEVREYYEREYVPRLAKMVQGQAPPPLDEVRERITNILSARKENAVLEEWLKLGRQAARIRFHEEAFR